MPGALSSGPLGGLRAPGGSGLGRHHGRSDGTAVHSRGSCLSVWFPPGMLVRYFYVSRQCTEYCPVIKPFDVLPPYKSYVLLKPTPFLYASCCRTPLCNTDSPTINDTEWHYYREAGGAHALRSGGAGLVLLLTLAAVSLGLRRS